MSFGSIDSDFDRYRKNRIRHQTRKSSVGTASGNPYENQALRELEQVEARELQDRKLTREVHDFFADATRQAATIVERMAQHAEAENEQKIDTEMESFLLDSFSRMNGLVMHMLQQRRGQGGEEKMEPKVANLVGQMLDEFRWEGTADLSDKHIGQDPFDTDLDEVRREFFEQVGESEMDTDKTDDDAAPIEDHLVATVADDEGAPVQTEDDMPPVEVVDEADDEVEDESAYAEDQPAQPAPQPAEVAQPTGAAAVAAGSPSRAELERFREALKSLVRQGTMSRDEARAAWSARLEKLGLARG